MYEELTNYVESLNTAVSADLDRLRRGKLTDVLRYYQDAKDSYDAFEKHRKKLGEMIESLSRNTIPEMMSEEGVGTVTLEDIGYRFTVSQRVSCTIQDKEAGYAWLRETGNESLITETVSSSTLSAFAKDYVEESGKDLPPEIFKLSSLVYTSVTKAK